MNDNAEVIRCLYAARAADDFDEVARLFADDVVWHEPGDFDYSGDHAGKEAVDAGEHSAVSSFSAADR